MKKVRAAEGGVVGGWSAHPCAEPDVSAQQRRKGDPYCGTVGIQCVDIEVRMCQRGARLAGEYVGPQPLGLCQLVLGDSEPYLVVPFGIGVPDNGEVDSSLVLAGDWSERTGTDNTTSSYGLRTNRG